MAEDTDPEKALTDKQSARLEPTSSERNVDLDLSDEEEVERREKRKSGELSVDDIKDPDLKERAEAARKKAEAQQEDAVVEDGKDDDAQRVQVSEGEDPLQAIEDEGVKVNDEADDDDDDDEADLMDGVDDSEIEDAMDVDLNIRDDIDPEHFDYDDQDFSVFGGYGQRATVEYNDTLFLLEQPGDREQEELINNMGGGIDDDGMQLSEMMNALIQATVSQPADIESMTAGWTPFERMGLGMQCMEFLGLDALGNM